MRSLRKVARSRAARMPNVRVVVADATRYRPKQPVDAVYFSYSLTMIPDWRAALDNALAMLVPGGALGVVDFHLPALAGEGRRSRSARADRFWRNWFAHDAVHLSEEHLPWLRERLEPRLCLERTGPVPYLPWLKVPCYVFVGLKARK